MGYYDFYLRIEEIVSDLIELALQFNGYDDGWGCKVINKKGCYKLKFATAFVVFSNTLFFVVLLERLIFLLFYPSDKECF